jgi:hypothetical protein
MSIPTMTFENLRDNIASPENSYSINNGFKGNNQAITQYTTTATDFLNMINKGGSTSIDNDCNDIINVLNEVDKKAFSIYKSDEFRRGVE